MIKENKEPEEALKQAARQRSKSFSDYLDTSIIVMVVGLFVAIVFTFLIDFIFEAKIDWKEIGINTVIVAACTIAIYLLLRSYAMRKGRRTKEWTEAFAGLQEIGKMIINENKAKFISDYCRAWEEERLENDIKDVLSPFGITLEEYKKFYAKYGKRELTEKYPDLTEYQLKAILRAQRLKRVKFDERYFSVNVSHSKRKCSPSSGLNTQRLNRIETTRIILTTLLTSLVSASFLREIIFDFSAESVIKCVVKIAIILFFGAMGMIGGYTFSSVREVNEMNAKSDEIKIFLKWCGERKDDRC